MAASNFAACLAFTLKYEGGKVDDRRDPGGRTNQGVTQRTFSTWLNRRGEPARDVYGMTPAERDAIYQTGFWAPIKGDMLPAGADLAMFDFGVNSGPARALKAYAKRTSGDGGSIVRTVCAQRLSFLHGLGTFRTFGRGWTTRVAACEATGVKMAEHARIGVPADAPTVPQVGTTLRTHGEAARARATRHRKSAAAVMALGGAAGATQMPGGPQALQLPWPAIALAVLVLGAAFALLVRRAAIHRERATAYAAVAAAR